ADIAAAAGDSSCLHAVIQCLEADIHCPGYDDKEPVFSRPRGRRRLLPRPPWTVLHIVCRSPRTAGSRLDLTASADAIEYYNHNVAPRTVGELAGYLRDAHINGNRVNPRSVARSRARSEAAASGHPDLLGYMRAGYFRSTHFASQVAAFKALGEELQDDFGPSISLGIILRALPGNPISTRHGVWPNGQAHGGPAGGLEVATGMDVELCRLLQQFALLDIFGMITHRLTEVTAETIISRVSIFHDSGVDSGNPWRLILNQLAKVLIRINVLRAQNVLFAEAKSHTDCPSTILDHPDGLPPNNTRWAAA
ncbi:hypothetical protein CTA2_8576, partial [Colletotrichum tanaceti]